MTVTEQEFWTGAHLPPEHDPTQCSTCRVRTEAQQEAYEISMLFPDGQPQCQWFALCDNPARHLYPHPILTEVPVCDRCLRWIERHA